MMMNEETNITIRVFVFFRRENSFQRRYSVSEPENSLIGYHCSYGHLPVITGHKWDYTFYKWGYKML